MAIKDLIFIEKTRTRHICNLCGHWIETGNSAYKNVAKYICESCVNKKKR